MDMSGTEMYFSIEGQYLPPRSEFLGYFLLCKVIIEMTLFKYFLFHVLSIYVF